MENEEWRPIEDCPPYEISDHGRVRRIIYKSWYIDDNGYPAVQLFNGKGKYKAKRLHQLVAKAFLPNPNNLPEVNHKHGDKLKFRPDDLEWRTRLGNMRHAQETGLHVVARGERNGLAKLTDERVKEIHAMLPKMPQREIAKLFGVSQYTISAIKRGLIWTHIPSNIEAGPNIVPFEALHGEQSPVAKLTDAKVLEIRALREAGELTEKEIGERFGVSQTTINMIIRRKTWTHI